MKSLTRIFGACLAAVTFAFGAIFLAVAGLYRGMIFLGARLRKAGRAL